HILWSKPVILLTNRSTFSAANYFSAFMRTLPNVTQVGATTGGGGGMPFSSSLPNGWTVRFSACPILDPNGQLIEDGVSPAPDNEVNFDLSESARGCDPILDRALDLLLHPAE
ncbi:MAG: peptidase S41, partial [Candidatus Amulumruptor sp.]|nr:peptidase S41 [Candidatus Amulumruptor sp.]